jgi:endonuclease/exonuclease/phosphatase family metal-dependent hydrolase
LFIKKKLGISIQLNIVRNYINEIIGKNPVIICVDLNCTKNKRGYKLMNEYYTDTKTDNRPTVWSRDGQGTHFKACLDYIFVKGMKINSFYQPPLNTYIPSDIHGSDHIYISAIVDIQ